MKVVFLGLTETEIQDMLDDGVDLEHIKRIGHHEGEVCEALQSIEVSNEFEENYYDLTFSDGFKVYDCSGFHLEEIK